MLRFVYDIMMLFHLILVLYRNMLYYAPLTGPFKGSFEALGFKMALAHRKPSLSIDQEKLIPLSSSSLRILVLVPGSVLQA